MIHLWSSSFYPDVLETMAHRILAQTPLSQDLGFFQEHASLQAILTTNLLIKYSSHSARRLPKRRTGTRQSSGDKDRYKDQNILCTRGQPSNHHYYYYYFVLRTFVPKFSSLWEDELVKQGERRTLNENRFSMDLVMCWWWWKKWLKLWTLPVHVMCAWNVFAGCWKIQSTHPSSCAWVEICLQKDLG